MISRVVVPVEESGEVDRALPVAVALGEWADVPLELLSIVAPSRSGEVQRRLDALAAGMEVEAEARVIATGGRVVPAMTTELDRDRHALWCVSSHARGAIGELIAGSVSEQLVRQAHVPLVVVGPGVATAPTGRVLAVALDGDDVALTIVEPAVELAEALGMTVRLLQVLPAEAPVGGDVLPTGHLAHVAGGSRHPAIRDFDVLHSRQPANELVEHARRDRAVGLIALATHGRRAVERLLHPSVALEVARRAPVPVVLLHPVGIT